MTLTFLVALYACNCATKPQQKILTVPITNHAAFHLLPPLQSGTPVDMAQRILGKYNGHEYTFTVWTISNATMLSITLMNDMGNGIGELTYTGNSIAYSSNFITLPVRPEYIAADFQLCFYDIGALSTALKKIGLTFIFEKTEKLEIRRVFDGENIIIEIKKINGTLFYTNFLRSYNYIITGDLNA
ncbi:MAG: DUF3261 domain-containing protein [Spirochaetaceae bacterium]|nr:DUF3261 domain-containing protein [Spirochaetaceae bacterium]